jgi:1-acyl-sn-glycerol-3-phosphate acyltransferase
MPALALAIRLLLVGVHLCWGMLQCALAFPWLAQRSRGVLVRRWSRGLLRIFGVRVEAQWPGQGGAAGVIVANHISWIDVFVLNAVSPCRFVAKSEVRSWPAIGWLSARAGTLYLARHSRAGLRAANVDLAHCIASGEPVAFFPEGTSGPQGGLLPFHANLFQAVIASDAPVQPVAIAYLDGAGRLAPSVEYIGDMSLWESILRLLSNGPIQARVTFLPPIASSGMERRTLAALAQGAVQAGLRGSAALEAWRGNGRHGALRSTASRYSPPPATPGRTWPTPPPSTNSRSSSTR